MKKTVDFDYVIGVDEVGRGPIAGPVTVCACIVPFSLYLELSKKIKGIDDSKKLTDKKRREVFDSIKEVSEIKYSIFSVSAKKIDQKGISWSIKESIKKALADICFDKEKTLILLDGKLFAPDFYPKQKTIIKGDSKEKIIGLASIIAKVWRDNYMIKLSKQYPQYGFEKHKGYGTKEHYLKIAKNGFSSVHRRTFCLNCKK